MPEAISDENQSLTPMFQAISIVSVPFFTLFGITVFAFKKLGIGEAVVATVLTALYTNLMVPIQKRVENRLLVRRGVSTMHLNTPTYRPVRVFIYTTLIVLGYFGAGVLLAKTLGEYGYVVGQAIDLLVLPLVSYLVGEWIGRSLAKRRDALLVAFGAPFLVTTLFWGFVHLQIGARKGALEAPQSGTAKELQQILAITTLSALLSVIIPMLVGAYRGAKYKPYYDLAFFAERLPPQNKEEIQRYVQRLRHEYVNASEPGPH
jgi:hypothetical protein